MGRRPKQKDPETLRLELIELLENFEQSLKREDLRRKVLDLVPSFHKIRDLGSSLLPLPEETKNAARDRILLYFRRYPGTVIQGDEFLVVSGIQEYARRIRELRVEFGWPILSGKTAKEMVEERELEIDDVKKLKSDSYLLLRDEQDLEAAYRWNIANSLRKEKGAIKHKILKFFKLNVGKQVTGEELKYIANGTSNWMRRIRELRTEDGWPIKTKNTGRPDLNVGEYILEEDRQSEVHDRKIPDPVRVGVLERDGSQCLKCGWNYDMQGRKGDPRHMLEIHHIRHHVKGGKNIEANLVTLCNVCHDEIHTLDGKNEWTMEEFKGWLG